MEIFFNYFKTFNLYNIKIEHGTNTITTQWFTVHDTKIMIRSSGWSGFLEGPISFCGGLLLFGNHITNDI